jgi:hypothetical protein
LREVGYSTTIQLYPELNARLTPYFGLVDKMANEIIANPSNGSSDADLGVPQVMENILGPLDV